MRFASYLVGTLGAGLVSAVAGAQARADFSGRWTIDSTAVARRPAESDSAARRLRAGGAYGARPADDMGSGWGRTITLAQDSTRLTVEYAFFVPYDLQPPFRFLYALDGSETTNSVNLGLGPQMQRSRAAWRGDTLVITTVQTFPHPRDGRSTPYEVTRRLSLRAPGSLLIETVIEGVLGGPPTSTRTVYRKE